MPSEVGGRFGDYDICIVLLSRECVGFAGDELGWVVLSLCARTCFRLWGLGKF